MIDLTYCELAAYSAAIGVFLIGVIFGAVPMFLEGGGWRGFLFGLVMVLATSSLAAGLSFTILDKSGCPERPSIEELTDAPSLG